VNNFEHHISALEALGFELERGMLIGEGKFATDGQIGTRFVSANSQIDTYLQTAFFGANKAAPKLGESQKISGPEGEYSVAPILEQ
jgi:hypothetical protein